MPSGPATLPVTRLMVVSEGRPPLESVAFRPAPVRFPPRPTAADRAGCRVGKDLARPGQCGHRHPDSRGVERVVAFAAERLFGQHGNDNRRTTTA